MEAEAISANIRQAEVHSLAAPTAQTAWASNRLPTRPLAIPLRDRTVAQRKVRSSDHVNVQTDLTGFVPIAL